MQKRKKTNETPIKIQEEKKQIIINIENHIYKIEEESGLPEFLVERLDRLEQYIKNRSIELLKLVHHINTNYITANETDEFYDTVSQTDKSVLNITTTFKTLHHHYIEQIYRELANLYNMSIVKNYDINLSDRHVKMLINGLIDISSWRTIIKNIFTDRLEKEKIDMRSVSNKRMINTISNKKYIISDNMVVVKNIFYYTNSRFKETIRQNDQVNTIELKYIIDSILYTFDNKRFMSDNYPTMFNHKTINVKNYLIGNVYRFSYITNQYIDMKIVGKSIELNFSDIMLAEKYSKIFNI